VSVGQKTKLIIAAVDGEELRARILEHMGCYYRP